MNVFDQVYRVKFGMFLVENIVVSFDMTIGCVHSTTGAMFRTMVP